VSLICGSLFCESSISESLTSESLICGSLICEFVSLAPTTHFFRCYFALLVVGVRGCGGGREILFSILGTKTSKIGD